MASPLLGIVLPSFARPEYAYHNPRTVLKDQGALSLSVTAEGKYLQLAESLYFDYVSDATAGNRFFVVRVLDENSRTVFRVSSSNGLAPNSVGTVFATSDLSQAYDGNGEFFVIGFPATLLYPGWTLTCAPASNGVADTLTNGYAVTTMIPTGELDPGVLAPTPVTPPTLLLV